MIDCLLQNLLFQTGWLLSTVKLRYGDSAVSAEIWGSSQTWDFQKTLPHLISILVSLRRVGVPELPLGLPSLALSGSCTLGKLWAGFIPDNPRDSWQGEGHVHGGRFGSSRGCWSYSSQGPLGLVSEGVLCEQGLLLLLSQSQPGGNAHFWPRLPFAIDVQINAGQRSQCR